MDLISSAQACGASNRATNSRVRTAIFSRSGIARCSYGRRRRKVKSGSYNREMSTENEQFSRYLEIFSKTYEDKLKSRKEVDTYFAVFFDKLATLSAGSLAGLVPLTIAIAGKPRFDPFKAAVPALGVLFGCSLLCALLASFTIAVAHGRRHQIENARRLRQLLDVAKLQGIDARFPDQINDLSTMVEEARKQGKKEQRYLRINVAFWHFCGIASLCCFVSAYILVVIRLFPQKIVSP